VVSPTPEIHPAEMKRMTLTLRPESHAKITRWAAERGMTKRDYLLLVLNTGLKQNPHLWKTPTPT